MLGFAAAHAHRCSRSQTGQRRGCPPVVPLVCETLRFHVCPQWPAGNGLRSVRTCSATPPPPVTQTSRVGATSGCASGTGSVCITAHVGLSEGSVGVSPRWPVIGYHVSGMRSTWLRMTTSPAKNNIGRCCRTFCCLLPLGGGGGGLTVFVRYPGDPEDEDTRNAHCDSGWGVFPENGCRGLMGAAVSPACAFPHHLLMPCP